MYDFLLKKTSMLLNTSLNILNVKIFLFKNLQLIYSFSLKKREFLEEDVCIECVLLVAIN